MPAGPPPPELVGFLREANPCVIATIRPDGELHTVATWYEWQDAGTVLVNMAETRLLGRVPRVSTGYYRSAYRPSAYPGR